jgi:hypothetical protein
MTWQPIKTAPKDGTEILAWARSDGFFVVFWYAHRGVWLWTAHELDGDEELNPTHWMPLPDPPA